GGEVRGRGGSAQGGFQAGFQERSLGQLGRAARDGQMPVPGEQSRQGVSGISLAGWLADAGLRNLPLEELVDGFARQLNEAGVPVARIFASTNTLHPMVVARSLIWKRETGPATPYEFQHADIDHPSIQTSPFGEMFQQGVSDLRLDLRQPSPAGEAPVFAELRELGMTDWLGKTFAFGELGPSIAGPRARGGMGELW